MKALRYDVELKRRNKRRKITAIVLLVLFAVILAFLVFFGQSPPMVRKGATDGDYEWVFAGLDHITTVNPRIVDLAMLGAHDAVSYSFDNDSVPNEVYRSGATGVGISLLKGAMVRYSKTQTVPLSRQLKQGVRYFHIECSMSGGRWYGEHMLLAEPLEVPITDILAFLDTHPGELVVILFQPMYLEPGATMTSLYDFVASVTYNGKSLYDYAHYPAANKLHYSVSPSTVRIEQLRYNDLTLEGTAAGVLLLDHYNRSIWRRTADVVASPYYTRYFDIDSNAVNTWHDRMQSDALINAISTHATYVRYLRRFPYYKNVLMINQTQASFTINDFLPAFAAWSLLDFAKKHNLAVLEHPDFDFWLQMMPIVLFDFATSDYGDFNRRINEKIADYNQNLINNTLIMPL